VKMRNIRYQVGTALHKLSQSLPMERAFSPSLYCCLNPGASPQAGISLRFQRLNQIKVTNWKRQRRDLYQPGAKPQGPIVTDNKGLKARATCLLRRFVRSRPNCSARKLAAFPDGSGEPPSQNVRARCIRASSGFTLLEVLVALVIFAAGAAVMLSLISGSLGNIRKVQLRTRTIEHAEAVMEMTLLDESIQSPTSFTGDFEDGTRWSVSVEEYIPPDIPDPMSDGRQVKMPVKLLSYSIEMFSPDSDVSDYQLHTLKMVRATPENGLVRMP